MFMDFLYNFIVIILFRCKNYISTVNIGFVKFNGFKMYKNTYKLETQQIKQVGL